MSVGIRKGLVEKVAEAAIESAWTQWRSLGLHITATRRAQWMVDPEALVLISLTLRNRERRLWDVLASWAKENSRLLSIQRVKNLQSRYPSLTRDYLAEFAHLAATKGGDHRWKKLASATPGPPPRDQSLSSPSPKGWDPAALMVRLRLGLGVGLQADILTFLLSLRGAWASARVIAEATSYSVYSIRRTADKMAEAQMIRSTMAKPIEYRADARAWASTLGIEEELPRWRYWSQAYAFVAELLLLDSEKGPEASTPYVLSSRLRDLVEKHQDSLQLNRIPYGESGRLIGEDYLGAFDHIVEGLTNWMSESA